MGVPTAIIVMGSLTPIAGIPCALQLSGYMCLKYRMATWRNLTTVNSAQVSIQLKWFLHFAILCFKLHACEQKPHFCRIFPGHFTRSIYKKKGLLL